MGSDKGQTIRHIKPQWQLPILKKKIHEKWRRIQLVSLKSRRWPRQRLKQILRATKVTFFKLPFALALVLRESTSPLCTWREDTSRDIGVHVQHLAF